MSDGSAASGSAASGSGGTAGAAAGVTAESASEQTVKGPLDAPVRVPAEVPLDAPADVPGGSPVDVVVLAGGTARRLGGASKPDVVARGARLLDHVLRGLDRLRDDGVPLGVVCVVAPEQVALPAGVLRTLEDPPLGGPVAGIAAGLARLRRVRRRKVSVSRQPTGPAPLTAVLTCDAPQGWQALPELLSACGAGSAGRRSTDGAPAGAPGPGAPDSTAPGAPEQGRAREGACTLQGDHVQYLLGVYRTAALERAVAPGGVVLRETAVRRALGGLDVAVVPPRHREAARDLDTWEEVRAWDW